MYCKQCNELMNKVMRFDGGKSYQLYRCPVCYTETKPKPCNFESDELSVESNHTEQMNSGKGDRKKRKGSH